MPTTVVYSPIGGPGAQFLDNNGVPLAGGKLYTYAAGTTTPVATYTTSAGTVAQANPIVLDSAGRPPTNGVWMVTATAYKFILKTSADVTIATWDNVTGATDSILTTASLAALTPLLAVAGVFVEATRATSDQTFALGTVAIVQYNSEITDLGGNYNPATYKFTVPVTGNYLVSASVNLSATAGPVVGEELLLSVFNNAAFLRQLDRFEVQSIAGAGTVLLSGSRPLHLTAADLIDIRVSNNTNNAWLMQAAAVESVLTITRIS